MTVFKKQLDRQWSEIFPAARVQVLFPSIDIFLYIVTPDYLCFPYPQILLMWLLLILVAIPTIYKKIKNENIRFQSDTESWLLLL